MNSGFETNKMTLDRDTSHSLSVQFRNEQTYFKKTKEL